MANTCDRGASSITAAQILDVAERLVQSRGFNGFSYADVAGELKITKPPCITTSPSKAELGEALINRYTDRFAAALDDLDVTAPDGPAKLGAMSTSTWTCCGTSGCVSAGCWPPSTRRFPAAIRDAVLGFFDHNETWLDLVLEVGRADGTLSFKEPARDRARVLVAALEGSMLVARPYGSFDRFEVVASRLVDELVARR